MEEAKKPAEIGSIRDSWRTNLLITHSTRYCLCNQCGYSTHVLGNRNSLRYCLQDSQISQRLSRKELIAQEE